MITNRTDTSDQLTNPSKRHALGVTFSDELKVIYRVTPRWEYWSDDYEEMERVNTAVGCEFSALEQLYSVDAAIRNPGWDLGATDTASNPPDAAVQGLAGSPGWIASEPTALALIRNRERRRLALALDRKIQRLAMRLLAQDPADHGIAAHRSLGAQAAARRRASQMTGRQDDHTLHGHSLVCSLRRDRFAVPTRAGSGECGRGLRTARPMAHAVLSSLMKQLGLTWLAGVIGLL
ncbi:hypothetical protein ACWC98_33045 [Streptomyces goshikiensis]